MSKMDFINYREIKRLVGDNLLIAVSKNQSIATIRALAKLGVSDFGENRVQEFLQKYPQLPDLNWHFIGQLQTNKVKYLIGKVKLIQSLDSLKLAEEIEKQSAKQSVVTDCLLQLKFDEKINRGGVKLDELALLYNYCQNTEYVKIRGFMVVAPEGRKAEETVEVFRQAKELFQDYQSKDKDFLFLSMGMSADYQLALENGANMVRIGSKLFTLS